MNALFVRMPVFLVLIVLLAGCGGDMGAFSAEEAAVRFGTEMMSGIAVVDPGSVEIRQVRDEGDVKYVLYSFTRQNDGRQERCLMLHEARRTALRTWVAGSGGGGCGGPIDGSKEEPPPLEMGGGSSAGSDDPQGYSHANGLVNREEIVTVRVTWDDGVVVDADVINGSYLVMRDGQHQISRVEGLDAEGRVLENNAWEAAPGKQ